MAYAFDIIDQEDILEKRNFVSLQT